MTDLVLNDEALRNILYRFVKDYAEAQHAIEIIEVAGSGAFELILTIIVAAVTGGAGVVAAVGSKMHLVRKFNKVGDLLADFSQATKRIKNRKKAFNGKNTDPGKLESVDGSVKKTDAHGAETGEVSSKDQNSPPLAAIPHKYSKTKEMDEMFLNEDDPNIHHPFWGSRTVKYLNDDELLDHELTVQNGKIVYANGEKSGQLFDTKNASSHQSGEGSAIFVMTPDGRVYASTYHSAGEFHHSSLSQGKEIAAGGELIVDNGVLKEVSNQSGHYQPSQEMNDQFLEEFKERGLEGPKSGSILKTGFDDSGQDFLDIVDMPPDENEATYIPKYWWRE